MAPIGVGSSSTVYRVIHEADGTEAALKVLADNHSLVAEMRQRFHDEATLLASVEHPGLARVYAVGETGSGQPYLAIELADRGDLRSRAEESAGAGRSPTTSDLLALGRQLTDALGALHEAGIVHRDVTPGNILIRAGGVASTGPCDLGPAPVGGDHHGLLRAGERLMIADLGLAKDLAFASGLTAGAGTQGFAAPEQREVVSVVDHRTDVYGATAVIGWVAEGSSIDADLDAFLARGMADDPEDRFASMEAWFAALTEAVSDSRRVGRSRFRARSRPARRLVLRFGPTSTLAVALVAVVAVAALIAAVVGTGGGPETTGPSASSTTISSPSSTGSDGAPDAGPTGTTIEVPTSETTTAQERATASTVTTTDLPPSSVPSTLAPTTTDPLFAGSPRAYIASPVDGATIDGDLAITGDARSEDGIAAVRLVVRDLDTGVHWHPETGSWEAEWTRFELPVEPVDGTAVTWGYTIPSDRLDPGRYLIRVWAVATPGNGDPVSDRIAVVVR